LNVLVFEIGTVLQEAGGTVKHIYFPHQGMVSLLAVMSDGQAIETATVGSEGVVGAMSGFGVSQSSTRAVVQAPLMASRWIFAKPFRKVRASEI
jgi:CRP-like cAMP-binding protein